MRGSQGGQERARQSAAADALPLLFTRRTSLTAPAARSRRPQDMTDRAQSNGAAQQVRQYASNKVEVMRDQRQH
jgi:hypothetical protein